MPVQSVFVVLLDAFYHIGTSQSPFKSHYLLSCVKVTLLAFHGHVFFLLVVLFRLYFLIAAWSAQVAQPI